MWNVVYEAIPFFQNLRMRMECLTGILSYHGFNFQHTNLDPIDYKISTNLMKSVFNRAIIVENI